MGCRGHSILAPGTQTRKWVWLTWSMGKSQSSSHSSSQSPLCWDLFYFYWLLGYCWWPMVWSLTWRTADWLTKDTLPWGLPTAETDSWLLTAVWVFLWWSQLEESCCLGRHHPDCHPCGLDPALSPMWPHTHQYVDRTRSKGLCFWRRATVRCQTYDSCQEIDLIALRWRRPRCMECCPACSWQIDDFGSLPPLSELLLVCHCCWHFLRLQLCCSSLISWLQPPLWPLKLSGVTCLAFWTIGMTMVLYLLLQKPLNHGLIVKVFDRLSMLPTIRRHLEFLSFGNFLCIVLCFLWQSFTKPSQKGLVIHCSRVSSEQYSVSSFVRHLSLLIVGFQPRDNCWLTAWASHWEGFQNQTQRGSCENLVQKEPSTWYALLLMLKLENQYFSWFIIFNFLYIFL